jgi:hypothetical protein
MKDTAARILLFCFFFFTITIAAFSQSITLTSPNGGESWTLGSTRNITWTVSGSLAGYVRLVLLKDGIWVGDIASGISTAAGTYSWNVGQHSRGTAAASGGYKIRVRHALRAIQDESDNPFTILAALAAMSSPVSMRRVASRRNMSVPGIIEHCYKRAYQPTSWNCLDAMGIGPNIMAGAGQMQVGYFNYYRERALVCRNEWRDYLYRGWVRFDDARIRPLAGQNIQRAELQMRNSSISVEHATEAMCAKGVYILLDPGRPGFEGFDVRSVYWGDLPPVSVGGTLTFSVKDTLERWLDLSLPNYGLMIRGKVEDLGARNNDKCISIFSDVRLFVEYTAR